MKKVLLTATEPTTATLLIALGIGLGVAVHRVLSRGFADSNRDAGSNYCECC